MPRRRLLSVVKRFAFTVFIVWFVDLPIGIIHSPESDSAISREDGPFPTASSLPS